MNVQLLLNETIVWQGKPDTPTQVKRAQRLSLLAIPWLAVTILIAVSVGTNVGSLLLGVPLALIGLLMLFAPLIAWHVSSNTTYQITTMRAFTIVTGISGVVKVHEPQDMIPVECVNRQGSLGDVLFTTERRRGRWGYTLEKVDFFAIEDAAYVAGLVEKLQVGG